MEDDNLIDLLLQDFGGIENKNYKEYNILTNPLELFMQELELAIKMGPTDVYNNPSSIDIRTYVFNRYITKQRVISDISKYVIENCEHASYFNWDVDVDSTVINGHRILHIIFTIYKDMNNPSDIFKKQFKIEG